MTKVPLASFIVRVSGCLLFLRRTSPKLLHVVDSFGLYNYAQCLNNCCRKEGQIRKRLTRCRNLAVYIAKDCSSEFQAFSQRLDGEACDREIEVGHAVQRLRADFF